MSLPSIRVERHSTDCDFPSRPWPVPESIRYSKVPEDRGNDLPDWYRLSAPLAQPPFHNERD